MKNADLITRVVGFVSIFGGAILLMLDERGYFGFIWELPSVIRVGIYSGVSVAMVLGVPLYLGGTWLPASAVDLCKSLIGRR